MSTILVSCANRVPGCKLVLLAPATLPSKAGNTKGMVKTPAYTKRHDSHAVAVAYMHTSIHPAAYQGERLHFLCFLQRACCARKLRPFASSHIKLVAVAIEISSRHFLHTRQGFPSLQQQERERQDKPLQPHGTFAEEAAIT